jgi:hypothetical protein
MALKPLNSVDGISVGTEEIDVIYANGDVSAANLVVSGESNLGPVGNVIITGGTTGQVITTDGSGNLSFTTITVTSNRAAVMPYVISTGDSYIVEENFQGLFYEPIDIEGEFEVDGILVDLSGAVANANYATNAGTVASSSQPNITSVGTLTSLNVSGNTVVGNISTTGVIKSTATTVDLLPSAVTVGAGARSFVTDANTTTFLARVGSGGSNAVPVVSDGTIWIVG